MLEVEQWTMFAQHSAVPHAGMLFQEPAHKYKNETLDKGLCGYVVVLVPGMGNSTTSCYTEAI